MIENHVCPSCGYCDCCGRGGGVRTPNPYPYPNPWKYPNPYTPTWTGGGSIDTTATFEVRN